MEDSQLCSVITDEWKMSTIIAWLDKTRETANAAKKCKSFYIKDFFDKCDQIDLGISSEEILHGKTSFFVQ